MINKKLSHVTLSDLRELIENEVGESKTIEYKSELYIEHGDDRKEFLADITSFANAEGGDIIYGIKENRTTNLPEDLIGIAIDSEDELLRKIESLFRDSISPRIPEIEFQKIAIDGGKYILIIRVGISALAPHRVVYKGYDKFFARNSKGKFPMDVNELRTAFTASQTLTKDIERYKEERLSVILANKYHELIEGHPIFVFQSIPVSAFRNNVLHSINEVNQAMSQANSTAFGANNKKQITVDGIRITNRNDYCSEIGHFNTNGIVELATTDFFFPNYEYPNRSPKLIQNLILSADIINKSITVMNELKGYYKVLDVNTPFLLSCAILNGRGFSFPKRFGAFASGIIDRDFLLIPDMFIEDMSIETSQILKPLFNALWNACGYLNCPAYNAEGLFTGLNDRDAAF